MVLPNDSGQEYNPFDLRSGRRLRLELMAGPSTYAQGAAQASARAFQAATKAYLLAAVDFQSLLNQL